MLLYSVWLNHIRVVGETTEYKVQLTAATRPYTQVTLKLQLVTINIILIVCYITGVSEERDTVKLKTYKPKENQSINAKYIKPTATTCYCWLAAAYV